MRAAIISGCAERLEYLARPDFRLKMPESLSKTSPIEPI
jgi:hypothetical protein